MDSLTIRLKRLIAHALDGQVWGSFARVTGYDASTHKARVTLQPTNQNTGYLPIIVPSLGWRAPLTPGVQVYVACDRGAPVAITGIVRASGMQAPTGAFVVEGPLETLGDLYANGLVHLPRAFALPPAVAANRGALVVVGPAYDGVAGAADALYCCLQKADGTLFWGLVTLT